MVPFPRVGELVVSMHNMLILVIVLLGTEANPNLILEEVGAEGCGLVIP